MRKLLIAVLLVAGCNRTPAPPVEALSGGQNTSRMFLESLTGVRDGDQLRAQAVYGGPDARLEVQMQFLVTPPTRLSSGTWTGLGASGTVNQKSVTFLGGQNGPPSLGGRFDLVTSDGRALYRITIPTQELRQSATR